MNTSPDLSSEVTFLQKYGMPVLCFCIFVLTLPGALRHEEPNSQVAFLFGIGFALLCWSAWPLKDVRVIEEDFVVSNLFADHRVPLANLRRISTHTWKRWPTISLYFDPPTPFGRHVSIIPPLRKKDFDEAVAYLTAIIRRREIQSVA